MDELLCKHLGISVQEVAILRTLDPASLLLTPLVRRIIDSINFPLLRASLPQAQDVLKRDLPDFYTWLAHDLNVAPIPTTPDHAIEWIEDFLLDRRSIPELIALHQRLSSVVLMQATPRFIHLFDALTFGRAEWQRAAALLCLALLAGAPPPDQGDARAMLP